MGWAISAPDAAAQVVVFRSLVPSTIGVQMSLMDPQVRIACPLKTVNGMIDLAWRKGTTSASRRSPKLHQ